jgi:putative membrane-bound dehydrogenase-like protein
MRSRLGFGWTLSLSAFAFAPGTGLAADPASRPAGPPADAAPSGVLPTAADGKPLNLDFETGTLDGWTANGKAFEGQPVKGDSVTARGRGMPSGHQGQFWVGGYEKVGDDETGTLTSAAFKADHPWATFMVAGGHWPQTRVELLTAADDKVFFKASGTDGETLRPVLVDLSAVAGKEIRVRLVDQRKGAWGHVNFDNFRLHDAKPNLPAVKEPAGGPAAAAVAAKGPPPGPADQLKFAGLPPEDAAKAMTLPPGFKAQVFAAEPDLINPIAFTIDARGRLWVAQSFTYPKRAPEGEGKDSILIFEDVDGDGKFDKRTVFAEKLNLVSGLEVGFGGVYVGAAPYLTFIPAKDDADGTTKQAGEPQVLLDGWGYQDTHETLNSFIWGPDGWLYGCHGIFTNSYVGKPGTPKEQRQHINGGYWRYHPTKHVFERFAEGTSNPWGLDYDEHGQWFAEGCVIPHMWHVIQGGRYQRQAGQHDNPYTFDDIKQSADHVHYLGNTPHSGNGRSDAAGGGHAHSGLMIYQGDNWPAEYRGKIFMNNIHGARINMDVPEPKGSGYVVHHGKDFLLANDRASQIIAMRSGPDGSVYMIDWYDLNQCHTNKPTDHDRTTGRIFKISYGDVKPVKVDLKKLSDAELVKLQRNQNVWFSRMARQVLRERAAAGAGPDSDAMNELAGMLADRASDEALVLRATWSVQAMDVGGMAQRVFGRALLASTGPMIRPRAGAWGIQLTCEDNTVSAEESRSLTKIAAGPQSPVVRASLASSVVRLPVDQRWDILFGLLSHAEDATDHNLPLMYWYGLESVMDADPDRALSLAAETKIPNILAFAVRRLAAVGGEKELASLTARLGKTPADAARLDILRGLSAGLKGRRAVPMPAGWDDAAAELAKSGNAEVASLAKSLSVTFGSKAAMATLKATLLDRSAPAADRLAAMESLLASKDPTLAPALQQLLDDPAVRGPAIRGLAGYDDANTPAAVLGQYGSFSAAEKKDAVLALAGRPAFAKALAAAAGGPVPKADFSADVLRQMRSLNDKDLSALLDKHWVATRETEKDKLDRIAKLKAMLDGKARTAGGGETASGKVAGLRDEVASLPHGRAIFARTCAQCHTLFGEGGKVGPDITGSDRGNLDYLLTNVVDPNALIPVDYQAWTLDTKDDRTIVGIVKKEDAQAVTIQTANEVLTVPRSDVAKLRKLPVSMMPEGLLDNVPEQDVRDLVGYLRSPIQVPVLADADAAKQLFNGKDLTGWEALEEGLYSVEDGQIVGRSKAGLKKNQFLTSKLAVRDFRLVVQMKLTPNKENSGLQFRSVRLPNSHEMKGTQADAGDKWWGKLYEESGRGLLFPKKGQEFDAAPFLKADDWNTYEVLAVGGKIRTAINGHRCADVDDDQVAKEGIFGLQLHAGGPLEVRWKDFELEVDPKFELKTVRADGK